MSSLPMTCNQVYAAPYNVSNPLDSFTNSSKREHTQTILVYVRMIS